MLSSLFLLHGHVYPSLPSSCAERQGTCPGWVLLLLLSPVPRDNLGITIIDPEMGSGVFSASFPFQVGSCLVRRERSALQHEEDALHVHFEQGKTRLLPSLSLKTGS